MSLHLLFPSSSSPPTRTAAHVHTTNATIDTIPAVGAAIASIVVHLDGENAFQLDGHAGLLETLSFGRGRDGFSHIHASARAPEACVTELLHEEVVGAAVDPHSHHAEGEVEELVDRSGGRGGTRSGKDRAVGVASVVGGGVGGGGGGAVVFVQVYL
eukprot:scaffold1503_cov150-Ochromonas_danica.AAC.23